jgi:hypothetical protein
MHSLQITTDSKGRKADLSDQFDKADVILFELEEIDEGSDLIESN